LEENAEVFIFGERGRAPPKGIAGGGDALPNIFSYQHQGKWCRPPMVSKMLGIELKRGERVRLETPGGGGWGNPSERDVTLQKIDEDFAYITNSKNLR
jgi:N-methylhydantoinase B